MAKNYYDILGVNKDASTADIRKAFKKLSIKYHPDKHINDSEEDKKKAEEKFKEINEAYETLSDEQKRNEYDNPIPSGFDPFGGFADFFSRGQRQRFVTPGQDIGVKVNLDIKDFYNGGIKEIKYKKNIRCGYCNGEGGETKICPYCHGNGTIEHRQQQGNMTYIQTVPCYHCNGTGKIVLNKCSKCNGSGFTKEDRVFNLNINDLNPTMPSGDYILSHGMGHESSDPQGPDGNLIGHVNINLGNYKVQNGNVFEQVEIPYYDILLGTDKEIKLPNGKEITVKIPSNSNNEDVIRSKGNGLNGKDYYLCIKATFPKTRKDDDKQLKKIKKNHS